MSVVKGQFNYTAMQRMPNADNNNIVIPIENSIANIVITNINWGYVPFVQPFDPTIYDTEFSFGTLSIFRNSTYDDSKTYFVSELLPTFGDLLFVDTISQGQLFLPHNLSFENKPIEISSGERGFIVVNSLYAGLTTNSLGVYITVNAYQSVESTKHKGGFRYNLR